ncbi:uncharacterized protein [Misgurnus anguillicaudatus]|uniref:uncharacterized protein n=1 Tax=Misgurnus anguillicaudatus TaxID=75329 RepID=UPI003CCF05A3
MMDAFHAGDDGSAELDFSAEPFTIRREPIQEIIRSFGSLFLETEEEAAVQKEEISLDDLPPPPPVEEEDESLISLAIAAKVNQLSMRMDKMEEDIMECIGRVERNTREHLQRHDHSLRTIEEQVRELTKQMTTQAQLVEQNQRSIEEKLTNTMEKQCSHVKQLLEGQMQDMGEAMMDCMKRRDIQFKSMVRFTPNAVSTPIASQTFTTSLPVGQTTSTYSTIPYKAAVRLEFPIFGRTEGEDPMTYLERCEEYLSVRPMNDGEILAILPSILMHTAKDWWMAEKTHVKTWNQFKAAFLRSFLPDDHEVEAERKIRERKQGIGESIRTFAFQYRAMCLRLKPTMTEREILQATLRNCNPRIGSILRSTVNTFDELVRVGVLVERDMAEERAYWKQHNAEQANRRGGTDRSGKGKSGSHNIAMISEGNIQLLTFPVVVQKHTCDAVIDTGSSYSLIQESLWRK